jgi:rhodanese-related sulfurtransferase
MERCVNEIAPRELAGWLAEGRALVLLDVREPAERALCAIAASGESIDMHVPMQEIPSRVGEIRLAAQRAPVVVYCHHGVRSRMVAEWLHFQGLGEVSNLPGGIDAWSEQVDPAVPRY